MKFKQLVITPSTEDTRSKILIVYTGGTFGMAHNEWGSLIPFDFSSIVHYLPTVKDMRLGLTVMAFDQPVDSSDIVPEHWKSMAGLIFDHYANYDGFVILHGTDTMAYTASALSFMLRGLTKPIILTGAQLPISAVRTDARENLITALEIASAKSRQLPVVPEVSILFNNRLLRGNRSRKVGSVQFDAFESNNYQALATIGVHINYNQKAILPLPSRELIQLHDQIDERIVVLRLFPGISLDMVRAILSTTGIRAMIIETYGSGNAPSDPEFIDLLQQALKQGIIIVNVSQCHNSMVDQTKYETGRALDNIGVIGSWDMTVEAALTKLMVWMGENPSSVEGIQSYWNSSIAGEITL